MKKKHNITHIIIYFEFILENNPYEKTPVHESNKIKQVKYVNCSDSQTELNSILSIN